MTTAAITLPWHEANQRYLTAALAAVRSALETGAEGRATKEDLGPGRALKEAAQNMPAPPALDTLCAAFGLTRFERGVLLLCAGPELDAGFAACLETAQGGTRRVQPTFGLALATVPEAHWSALSPVAPLRHWRILEIGAGDTLTQSPLRIEERVLHYLTGIEYLDERLSGIVEAVPPSEMLSPSQQRLVEMIATVWGRHQDTGPAPLIDLYGSDGAAQRSVAAAACAALGIRLCAMRVEEIPAAADVCGELARLWEREAILSRSALLVDWDDAANAEAAHPSRRFVERLSGLVLTAGRVSQSTGRTAIHLEVRPPSSGEQENLWRDALGPRATELNGALEMLTAQFHLNSRAISTVRAAVMPESQHLSSDALTDRLWDTCRAQARVQLDDLAQRIEPAAGWADLVLPAAQTETLRDVAMHVRRQATVYGEWGFAQKGARGLGISALFAGPSGTGKTMAAEVLAGELRLDLYRIDLSSVVSKYIGETEKNLRRVFDAAEEGGAILLFDEADALFGKRSEVKDSHDRYANIEVSYLLQRMEAYRGLAVLTTNAKRDLDPAFLRRLRFVVQFPFPDAALRAEIWRRIFPARTPTDDLDAATLARLNVPGGAIRNIALNAAFLAADSGTPVGMAHVLRAARTEYAKLEKPLAEIATGGWA